MTEREEADGAGLNIVDLRRDRKSLGYCDECGASGENCDSMHDRIKRLKEKLYDKNLSAAEAKHTMRQLTRMERMMKRRKEGSSGKRDEDDLDDQSPA
eukprot:CAMPEP_0198732362 /NCGR_PEP_ID=MMETSP1475-20131203/35330_1 /TAXON_ID= ORGANISM="Unidentified sp., Strain CCMP1999" /NCGR_SAMPLE_ID=MMETSP1475 /ASSEMBLY_ACC=CAM_ASM_001111 /LENGTH=97 /DNA_ID=CAMNT_0044495449 /DNA_START=125 /DNA_END=418 /DNA_ORIENTATION=-